MFLDVKCTALQFLLDPDLSGIFEHIQLCIPLLFVVACQRLGLGIERVETEPGSSASVQRGSTSCDCEQTTQYKKGQPRSNAGLRMTADIPVLLDRCDSVRPVWIFWKTFEPPSRDTELDSDSQFCSHDLLVFSKSWC